MVDDLDRFQYDLATFKVDWALSGPIPWRAEVATRAGHRPPVRQHGPPHRSTRPTSPRTSIPAHPFVLIGQMNKADPTRSPVGTETVWAYTHVPLRVRGDAGGNLPRHLGRERERDASPTASRPRSRRTRPASDRWSPARHLLSPPALEALDANLVGGALGGGTIAFAQQLVFRPVPGPRPGRDPGPRPVPGVVVGPPGGGVHGACGANAARAAIVAHRIRRVTGRAPA